MTCFNFSIKVARGFLIVFTVCAINLQAWAQEIDMSPEISIKVAAATVKIICNDGFRTGSGSIIGITDEGRTLILTTAEVVSSNFAEADPNADLEFYDTIEAKLPNSPEPVTVNLLVEFVDRSKDIALVGTRFPAPSERLMSYARAGKIKPGQPVVTYGYSDITRLSLTKSSVISVTEKYLVLDTRWATGSSGGPIVDNDGRMVGLATSLTTGEDDQRGYAIRIGVVSAVVNDWLNTSTGLKVSWQSEGKKFPTFWVIGGVLAAGGITTGALLLTGDGEKGFPEPPFRPDGN